MKICKIIIAFLLLITCLFSLTGCGLSYTARERKHYMDKSNFVTVTATCISCGYYTYPTETHYYAIDYENEQYEKTDDCVFQNVTFRVDKYSAEILKEHGIEEKLKPGMTFTCMSAPIYLNNSYDCPIVMLEIDGEVLLDFETGYRNLMATYGVDVP